MVELCLLLEAQGAVVAPVPLWATLVLGALPVAEFGSDGLRAALLPGVVAGDVVLTAALADVANDIAVGWRGTPGRDRHPDTGRRARPVGHRLRRPLRPCGHPGAGAGRHRRRPGSGRGRPDGPRRHRRTGVDHQPRDPSPPPPRRGDRVRRRPARRGRRLPAGADVVALDPRAGLDRAVCPADRDHRVGGRPDGRVPQHPSAVRPPTGHLPGHQDAGRRRGHRHRGGPGDDVAGGMASRQRPGRRTGRQRGLVVRRRVRPAGGVRHPAPPRWHGRRHLLSDPPLLPVGQADRAPARIAQRPTGPTGSTGGGGPDQPRRCRHEQGHHRARLPGRPPGPWTR